MPDPFHPKFVDLVRNFTSSQGSGPIALGAAVTGYTGIAQAVAPGEQFYYCIQGVDKPAEREVGRGTMQANGTISRQPISGSLTSFTAGTKTIALVAAAEWYSRVDQGGGAGAPPITVASRTALAALVAQDGDSRLLTEAGREGLFVFAAGNFAAQVASDTRQGIYVAPAASPGGSSGAWVRHFAGPVHIQWFLDHASRTPFVTDDLPAFLCARNTIKARTTGPFVGVDQLSLGRGRFYISDRFDLDGIHMFGTASGYPGGVGTVIRCGKNKSGLRLNFGPDHGHSTIRDLALWGGGITVDGAGNVTDYSSGDVTAGNGVEIACDFASAVNVHVFFFDTGWYANSFTIAACNTFLLDRCGATYCKGDALKIIGSDANAGTTINFNAVECGGSGIDDVSFLGNTHIQPHVRDCGISDPTASGGPAGACVHGGNYYAVARGQEAAASTTTPGTNSAVWSPHAGWYPPIGTPTWVSGMTWRYARPYSTNLANEGPGRGMFVNPYAESGQASIAISQGWILSNGVIGEVGIDRASTGCVQAGTRLALTAPSFQTLDMVAGTTEQYSSIGEGNNIRTGLLHRDGSNYWRVGSAPGGSAFGHLGVDLNGSTAMMTWNPTTGQTHVRGLVISNGSSLFDTQGAVQFRPAAPTAGSWNKGDIVFNTGDGPDGWRCIAAGTPGTWRPFGGGSVTSQAGTSYTAALADANGFIRFTSGSAVTFTVPPNSSVAFPVGTVIEIEQAGAGTVTVAPGSGVTINSRGAADDTAGQYAVAALKKVATDTWTLAGDIA